MRVAHTSGEAASNLFERFHLTGLMISQFGRQVTWLDSRRQGRATGVRREYYGSIHPRAVQTSPSLVLSPLDGPIIWLARERRMAVSRLDFFFLLSGST